MPRLSLATIFTLRLSIAFPPIPTPKMRDPEHPQNPNQQNNENNLNSQLQIRILTFHNPLLYITSINSLHNLRNINLLLLISTILLCNWLCFYCIDGKLLLFVGKSWLDLCFWLFVIWGWGWVFLLLGLF